MENPEPGMTSLPHQAKIEAATAPYRVFSWKEAGEIGLFEAIRQQYSSAKGAIGQVDIDGTINTNYQANLGEKAFDEENYYHINNPHLKIVFDQARDYGNCLSLNSGGRSARCLSRLHRELNTFPVSFAEGGRVIVLHGQKEDAYIVYDTLAKEYFDGLKQALRHAIANNQLLAEDGTVFQNVKVENFDCEPEEYFQRARKPGAFTDIPQDKEIETVVLNEDIFTKLSLSVFTKTRNGLTANPGLRKAIENFARDYESRHGYATSNPFAMTANQRSSSVDFPSLTYKFYPDQYAIFIHDGEINKILGWRLLGDIIGPEEIRTRHPTQFGDGIEDNIAFKKSRRRTFATWSPSNIRQGVEAEVVSGLPFALGTGQNMMLFNRLYGKPAKR